MNPVPSLTPLQRMLLRTDGTLTPILEAYAGEAVEVVRLHQEYDLSTEGDGALLVPPGVKVLRRRVVLRGSQSRRSLLYAEAVIVPERVEPCLVEDLLGTDKPIGALLSEYRVETLRDILVVEREPAGPAGRFLGADPAATVLSRTYRIVAGHRPIMLITEKFRAELFRTLRA